MYEGDVPFAVASRYGHPPMETSHHGGIFTSQLLDRGSPEAQALVAKNERVLAELGLLRGVSHTEFIRGEDGKLYFLETSARVGGAHIAELVEAATGINLWAEWAKVEIAGGRDAYAPPAPAPGYAGLLVSLARQEHPVPRRTRTRRSCGVWTISTTSA
jgi:biotin carboxylase